MGQNQKKHTPSQGFGSRTLQRAQTHSRVKRQKPLNQNEDSVKKLMKFPTVSQAKEKFNSRSKSEIKTRGSMIGM